jgi:hypothetical protein
MNATVRNTGFRSILAAAMAMASSVNANVKEMKEQQGAPYQTPSASRMSGVNFARTFTGKRQRIKAKKRDKKYLGNLTRMKHKRSH